MANNDVDFDPNVPLVTGKPTKDDLARSHRSARARAVDKIVTHGDVAKRVEEFLKDEVLNLEQLHAWARGADITKNDILAATLSMIQDRKDDIAEIVPLLAYGQLIHGVIKK